MQRVVKKRLTLLFASVIIVVSYILCRYRTYDHEESVVIKHVPPSDIWEFVADFSNMKYLNPTIVDFNILSESGNYRRWQYSTEYTEQLSHWPYLTNRAVAHFDVVAISEQSAYYILSNHHTCLLGGLLCCKYRCSGFIVYLRSCF
ncbi:hypothetical protein RI129_010760 [Pyrocoelia pectoralis]|uniref:Uncharacterized protein n=1 Tax=Pyrocoelia pectoralis TaxID=417401 RepID=A0AAN7VAP9_9COLE